MSDREVNKWKQAGRVYLWRYTENIKNYPGWHLTADDVGCKSLLDLLNRLESAWCLSTRSIKISPPSHNILMVPGNQGGYARWESPKCLKLVYPKDEVPESHWHIKMVDSKMVDSKMLLTVGLKSLKELQRGIEGIMRGKGDYAIGSKDASKRSEEMCLWFWWMIT